MPEKDQWGIWREDKVRVGVNVSLTEDEREFLKCPECGGEVETGFLYDDQEIDWELAAAWGYEGYPPDDEIWQFCFCTEMTYCDEDDCNWSELTGADYYADPKFHMIMARPLLPEAAAQAQLKADRAAQIAAGQLELIH